MDEPPEEEPPQDEQTTLASELAAARAENEMLLQQITRLCVYIEQTTGVDPIEVMHGRVEPPPVPVAPPPPPPPPQPPPAEQKAGFAGCSRVPACPRTYDPFAGRQH